MNVSHPVLHDAGESRTVNIQTDSYEVMRMQRMELQNEKKETTGGRFSSPIGEGLVF